MWFLYALSWASTVLQICFVTLAIAAGLYYLAELVEEYTVVTAKAIRWMIILVIFTYIGLFMFENLPTSLIMCGLFAQVAHLALLTDFPFFSATSPSFILAVAMVLVNHYFAFSFFGENYYPFSEVMSYFTICMWLVPFAFFVSLSGKLVSKMIMSSDRYGLGSVLPMTSMRIQRSYTKFQPHSSGVLKLVSC